MADPAPSHVPDPAPPAPAAAPGLRRIRSVPPPVRGTSLLNASASGYGEDMNWRRGVGVLWTLIGLIAFAEACNLAFHVFGGYGGWPNLVDSFRLCLVCAVFLALWFGWNWTRWVLAVFSFLFGVLWLIQLLRITDLALSAGQAATKQTLPGSSFFNAPIMVGALLYLILAVYLAFSGDVTGFTKHRREAGRPWVAVPVAVGLCAYLALMLVAPLGYGFWLQGQGVEVAKFGEASVRAIGERWDPDTVMALSDARLQAEYPAQDRGTMLDRFKGLGAVQSVAGARSRAYTSFEWQEQEFVRQGNYEADARCAHGAAHFSFLVTRPFLGPWKLLVFHVTVIEE